MIGTTCQKSKLGLPSKILAPHGYSFSSNALNGWRAGISPSSASRFSREIKIEIKIVLAPNQR
jgi:hypothetical protein